jgi:hypothetical protein
MTDDTGRTVDRGIDTDAGDVSDSESNNDVDVEELSGSGPGDAAGVATDRDEEASPQLPLNQTFEILRNQRRRYVLRYLEGTEGEVSLGELAEQIAAWENDKEVSQISSRERKRVYVGLYQCHLPKMDGMDVVSFNKPRGLVEPGEHADWVCQYLHREDASDEPVASRGAVALSMLGITGLPVAVLLLTEGLVALVLAALSVLALTAAAVLYLR